MVKGGSEKMSRRRLRRVDVFCAGAAKAALSSLAPGLSADLDIDAHFTFGPVGSLTRRIYSGETPNVVVLNDTAVADLVQRGIADCASIVPVGLVSVGIAVRRGAVVPDVSTVAKLRDTLLRSRCITYGDPARGDSSGIHFSGVLEALGIADVVKHKTVLAPMGADVGDGIVSGTADIGVTQSSIILSDNGMILAGLLPVRLRHDTLYEACAATMAAGVAATEFLKYIQRLEARATFQQYGFAGGVASAGRKR